jgi:L-fuculose-phosphate aldolase
MISTEGIASVRLNDESYLITPTGLGRRTLNNEDIVLIKNGMREKGKNPSRSVLLHEMIYRNNTEINCIITAKSPNVAAYAITSQKLDTRTIPESYLLLRDIPLISYDVLYKEPHKIADILTNDTPVLLFKNDCILVTATNILQAFDRLEVASFTAGSLIDAKGIGELVPIRKKDIFELKENFLREDD